MRLLIIGFGDSRGVAGRVFYYNNPVVNPDDRILKDLERLCEAVQRERYREARRRLRWLCGSNRALMARTYAGILTSFAKWAMVGNRRPTDAELDAATSDLLPVWSRLAEGSVADLRTAVAGGGPTADLDARQVIAAMVLIVNRSGATVTSLRPKLMGVIRKLESPEDILGAIDRSYQLGDGQHVELLSFKALRDDPECGHAFVALAQVMRVRQHPLRASRFLRAATRRSPDDSSIPYAVAAMVVQWTAYTAMVTLTGGIAMLAMGSSDSHQSAITVVGLVPLSFWIWLGISIGMRMGRAAAGKVRVLLRSKQGALMIGGVLVSLVAACLLGIAAGAPQRSTPIATTAISLIVLSSLVEAPAYLKKARRSQVRRDFDLGS